MGQKLPDHHKSEELAEMVTRGCLGCHELRQLAIAVRNLRAVQKTAGTGYKTPVAGAEAASRERTVDQLIVKILGK